MPVMATATTAAAAGMWTVVAVFCLLSGLAGGASRLSVCQDDFLIREGTIIRTVDSRNRGAKFLNNTEVAETSKCLEACCDRAGCNAAIYDQKVGRWGFIGKHLIPMCVAMFLCVCCIPI